MHFKTLKTSETGKKLQHLEDRLTNAMALSKYMIMQLKADGWKNASLCYSGGISEIEYKDPKAVPNYMKELSTGNYMPNMESVEGRKVQSLIDELPTVTIREMNTAVGIDGKSLISAAFYFSNKKYYLWTIYAKAVDTKMAEVHLPKDCDLIKKEEYSKLMKA